MYVDTETIKKIIQKCRLKKMFGQVVVSLEAGEVKSVDIKEHLKPEDLTSYASKMIVAIKKDTGGGTDGKVEENGRQGTVSD